VNVITGTIKANFPTRIAFQVTSQVDSRTILDVKGAESLLGRGDMLFKPPGASKLERNQGSFVHDDEIERVVSFVSAQAEQQFDMDVFKTVEGGGEDGLPAGEEPLGEADEELIQKAIEIILRDRRPTTSYIQRCLRIGYNRAALIIEILEQRGVIGPQIGTAPREILVAAPGGSDATPGEPDVDEVPGADPDADRA
jgi:S-DNA-T family DNA segregation ATPase FtsK/SpoIIIE